MGEGGLDAIEDPRELKVGQEPVGVPVGDIAGHLEKPTLLDGEAQVREAVEIGDRLERHFVVVVILAFVPAHSPCAGWRRALAVSGLAAGVLWRRSRS